jgi:hypothetical protein
MKMRISLFIAAALVAGISFQNASYGQAWQAQDDPLRHGHALLIGNFDYEDRGWDTLGDIPLQLNELYWGLQKHFDDVVVRTNLETDQLRQDISSFLRYYENDTNARLFIYYAGHGYTETIYQVPEVRGYITGVDTPVVNNRSSQQAYDAARRRAIPMQEILNISALVLAKHILFVFDSCFAGTIFTTRGANDATELTSDLVAKRMEKQSRDFITAGRDNERVPARSPIPDLLLRALSGKADRYGHGVISAADIRAYLYDQVRNINLTPQYGRHPLPAFSEGEFLFRVIPTDVSMQPPAKPTVPPSFPFRYPESETQQRFQLQPPAQPAVPPRFSLRYPESETLQGFQGYPNGPRLFAPDVARSNPSILQCPGGYYWQKDRFGWEDYWVCPSANDPGPPPLDPQVEQRMRGMVESLGGLLRSVPPQ